MPDSINTDMTKVQHMRCFIACMVLMLAPITGNAGLGALELDTRTLEDKVADDPRAANREGEVWQQQGLKSGDKKLELRGLRLSVMASAQLEENVTLAKLASQGLELSRQLRDPQAECEFLSGKATALSSAGKHLDALLAIR